MDYHWTDAQEAAMNLTPKLYLVSAAAGSGKTTVLAERIIRSLTDPVHPVKLSRLLVVTFTRAAAAELKTKIGTALSEALAKNPNNENLAQQLLFLDNANISTIDSFFTQVLRSHFEELNLPSGFRIAEEKELFSLSLEVMDASIRELYAKYKISDTKNASAFENIERNLFAASCMDHLMKNRQDKDLDQKLLEFYNQFAAFPEGIERLALSAKEIRKITPENFISSAYGLALSSYLISAFTEFLQKIEETNAYVKRDVDFDAKLSGLLAENIDFCTHALQALQSADWNEFCKCMLQVSFTKFPTIKNKPQEIIDYQLFRNELKSFSVSIRDKFCITDEAEFTNQIVETANLADLLFELYSKFQKSMEEEKLRRGVLEFNDIRCKVYHLLTLPDGSPSPIANSIADSFDAIYIDEYQDVDFMQDSIFKIIGENRRFMVGDMKQSIYCFRGSEPSIFSGYRKKYPLSTEEAAKDADGECVFMSDNFRCDEPIINYANRICSVLFSACEDSIAYRKEDDLICSKRLADQGKIPVKTVVFEKAGKLEEMEEDVTREAAWVAAEIFRMIHFEKKKNGSPITPADIAVLVRNISQASALVSCFHQYGIPVAGEGSENVFEAPLTIKLHNLLSIIDNPYKDICLAEYLLTPNAGFSAADVQVLRSCTADSVALFDAMQVFADTKDADESLKKKTQQFLSWLAYYRDLSTSLPADRFLRLLYLDPAISCEAAKPEALFLYEQARSYQKSSWCGLYGFLDALQKKADAANKITNGFAKAENAVNVLTIHKSKGLEFPVVFLFASGSSFRKNTVSTPLSFRKNTGFASSLFQRATGENQDSIFRKITLLEQNQEETEENIRILYVALTRAKERLIVSGTLSSKLEKLSEKLVLIRKNARYGILSANSYLQWILSCLSWQNDVTFISATDTIPTPQKKPLTLPLEEKPEPQKENTELQEDAPPPLNLQEDILDGIPTKLAASKICPNLVDLLKENLENAKKSTVIGDLDLQLMVMDSAKKNFDVLLDERKKPTPAEIGTAMHNFLQVCNYQSLTENGLQAELDRLLTNQFLSKRELSILNQKQLALFLKSDLFRWVLSAKNVIREQQFGKLFPLSQLTKNADFAEKLSGKNIFVQGSMDLIVEFSDGTLYLIDYKTDHITEEEKADELLLQTHFSERHKNQLSFYALAFRDLFGKLPDKVFLYSLPLGKLIETTVDTSLFSQKSFQNN